MHCWDQEDIVSCQSSFPEHKKTLIKIQVCHSKWETVSCNVTLCSYCCMDHGCESWSMTKQSEKSIDPMEMCFWRRISVTINAESLNTPKHRRKLMSKVKRRQGTGQSCDKKEKVWTLNADNGRHTLSKNWNTSLAGKSTVGMFVNRRDCIQWMVMMT